MAEDLGTPLDDPGSAHESILAPLFESTFKAAPVEFIYTLLRVGGLQMADWDSFEESRAAFKDYNWILGKVHERGDTPTRRLQRVFVRVASRWRGKSMWRPERMGTSARRVGLLMYCQAVEMNAVHEILANLLRCKAGEVYSPAPLRHLGRSSKKGGLAVFTGYVPPSATQKYRAIKQLALHVGHPELNSAIDRFFDERVRNAFSHSDYILTEDYFRFREGGLARQIDVEALDRLIVECFAFYSVFMSIHDQWLHTLGRGKRFHQWPNYEVLELLSTEEEGLYGFNVHFSNGSKATFMRRKSTGTMGSVNIMFDKGGINFWVGQLETLEKAWKVEGKTVEDWSILP